MVLPRTEKQIDAAKRAQTARLGQSGAYGKRKRCKKGKSCGASCISGSKFCLVDLPWASNNALTKVAGKIQSNKKTKAGGQIQKVDKGFSALTDEQVRERGLFHLGKMKEAATAGDGKAYDLHRNKTIGYKEEMKKRGILKEEDDLPLPKWSQVEPVIKKLKDAIEKQKQATEELKDLFSKPSTVLTTPAPKEPAPVRKGPEIKLDKLVTTSDFADKVSSTQGFYNEKIKAMHTWMEKLLGKAVLPPHLWPVYGSDAEKKFFEKLQKRFLDGLDGGELVAKEAYRALKLFTGNVYTSIRAVQKGRSNDPNYRRMAEVLEKFLARPEADKPEVEKFRGYAVTKAALKGMIESAKQSGTFEGQALASWSTALRTSKTFAGKTGPNREQRVILRAVNKAGVPIGTISSISSENEILTPGTANYKYVSYTPIKYDGYTYHVFDVEEFA